MKHPEYELQKQVVEYIDLQYPDALYCATLGGVRLSIGAAVKLKRQGYRKGIPDLIIYEPRFHWHGLAIEIKSDKGQASPEQEIWLEKLVARGWLAVCLNSFDLIKITIDSYFSAKNA